MKNELILKLQAIENFASKMQGVFSKSDLETIFGSANRATFFNLLNQAMELGVLTRFTRGVYVTKNYSPAMLSARIDPSAYLSLGTVLAKNGLIGTLPQRLVTAVKVGKRRTYSQPNAKVCHLGISPDLYFGFSVIDGIRVADNEKAYLDLLYYRMKGERYVFDEFSDVDLEKLDRAKFRSYLSKYKNKRFVKFCEQVING